MYVEYLEIEKSYVSTWYYPKIITTMRLLPDRLSILVEVYLHRETLLCLFVSLVSYQLTCQDIELDGGGRRFNYNL